MYIIIALTLFLSTLKQDYKNKVISLLYDYTKILHELTGAACDLISGEFGLVYHKQLCKEFIKRTLDYYKIVKTRKPTTFLRLTGPPNPTGDGAIKSKAMLNMSNPESIRPDLKQAL